MPMHLEPSAMNLMESARLFCVYAIGPSESGPLKIGYTRNLNSRLINANNGNWVDLYVQAAYVAMSANIAMSVEREMHRHLSEEGLRIRGEWFQIDKDRFESVIVLAQTVTGNQVANLEGRTGNILAWCRKRLEFHVPSNVANSGSKHQRI